MSREKSIISNNFLGDRVKQVRKAKNLTQQAFAESLGISQQLLSMIETCKIEPTKPLLMAISYQYMVNLNWLLTGEGEMYEKPPIPEAMSVRAVPVLGRVPAGFPENVAEEIVEYISLPNAPQGSYALITKGESMSPSIKDGDYVLFIPNSEIRNGDIVVINNEWGETMLKRYREKGGDCLLTSDNPEFPSFKPNEHYKIMGKVIKVWREVKI